ncbi:MAG: hypothetical protein II771_09560, partial [Clostridia bacterium]|nr:hypothetical protein [Clostridia bacterium]
MKKIIVALLLLCMLTSLFSACAEKTPTDETANPGASDVTNAPAETEAYPNIPQDVTYDGYSF